MNDSDCKLVTCDNSGSIASYIGSYSLNAGFQYTNMQLQFSIGGKTYIIPTGSITITVPPSVISSGGSVSYDGCSSTLSASIPSGSSTDSISSIVNSLIYQAAQQQAQCNAAAANSGNLPTPQFFNQQITLASGCTDALPLSVSASLPSGVSISGNNFIIAAGIFGTEISQSDADSLATSFLTSLKNSLFSSGKAQCGNNCLKPFNPALVGTCPTISGSITSGVGASWSYCVYDCNHDKFIVAADFDTNVFILDPSDGHIITSRDLGFQIEGLVYVPTTNEVYVQPGSGQALKVISSVDLSDVATVTCGADANGLFSGVYDSVNDLVAVLGFPGALGPYLFIVDPATHTLVRTVTFPSAGYQNAVSIAYNPNNAMVYFQGESGAAGGSILAEVNPLTGAITDTLHIPNASSIDVRVAYSKSDGNLYVAAQQGGSCPLYKISVGPLTNQGQVVDLSTFTPSVTNGVSFINYDAGRHLLWMLVNNGSAMIFYKIGGGVCASDTTHFGGHLDFTPDGKSIIQKNDGNFSIVT